MNPNTDIRKDIICREGTTDNETTTRDKEFVLSILLQIFGSDNTTSFIQSVWGLTLASEIGLFFLRSQKITALHYLEF